MKETISTEHANQLLAILFSRDKGLIDEYLKINSGVLSGESVLNDAAISNTKQYPGKRLRKIGLDEHGGALSESAVDGYFLTASGVPTRKMQKSKVPQLGYISGERDVKARLSQIDSVLRSKLSCYQLALVAARFLQWRLSVKEISEKYDVSYKTIRGPVDRAIELVKSEI